MQGWDRGLTPVSQVLWDAGVRPLSQGKKFDVGLYKLFDICIKYRYTISLWICV